METGSKVYSTTFYIGLAIEPRPGESYCACGGSVGSAIDMQLAVGAIGTRRLDISYPTTEFTKVAKMWERFDEATMGLVVRHIKRSQSCCLRCRDIVLMRSLALHYRTTSSNPASGSRGLRRSG